MTEERVIFLRTLLRINICNLVGGLRYFYHPPKIVVNVVARRLRVYDEHGSLVFEYPIAVGSPEYKTPLGKRKKALGPNTNGLRHPANTIPSDLSR